MTIATQYIRDRHLIRLYTGGLRVTEMTIAEDCKTISRAKKWSRAFQKSNGGLGCGVLRVNRDFKGGAPVIVVGSVNLFKDNARRYQRSTARAKRKSSHHSDERVAVVEKIRKNQPRMR